MTNKTPAPSLSQEDCPKCGESEQTVLFCASDRKRICHKLPINSACQTWSLIPWFISEGALFRKKTKIRINRARKNRQPSFSPFAELKRINSLMFITHLLNLRGKTI